MYVHRNFSLYAYVTLARPNAGGFLLLDFSLSAKSYHPFLPHYSVVLLVIPVKRIVLHLWPSRLENPSKLELDILQQVTRELDMPYVRGMILRPDVVVLQDARRIEVVHKVRVRVVATVEIPVHILDLRDEATALLEGVAHRAEAFPEGEENYLRLGPSLMDFFD